MANPYSITIRSISTDGINLFLEIEIFDGLHQLPTIRPSFSVGTTAADIQSYIQTVANNQPALTPDINALVGSVIKGQ